MPTLVRRTLGVGLVLALSAALVACGESTSASEEPAAESSLLPAGEGTTQYPLTLTTWLGESVLEERPERVAVFGYSSTLDALEALDVVPVYYGGRTNEDYAWNDDAYMASIESTEVVEDFVPNAEAIAASEPDLIVTTGILTDSAQYEKLAAIAPVVDLPEDPGNGDQTDWREVQAQIGEAVDLAAAAQTAVTEADAAIEAVAAAHPEFAGKTSTIAVDYGAEWGLSYYTVAGGPAEGLMLDLGFVSNPSAQTFVADETVSDENVGLLDADVLVMTYNTEADRVAREAQPLFQRIPAVAEGRYESLTYSETSDSLIRSDGEEVDNAVWVLRRGASAVALPWAAEVITDQWLGRLDLS